MGSEARDQQLTEAIQTCLKDGPVAGEQALRQALESAGSFFREPLPRETLLELARVTTGSRTESLDDAVFSIIAPHEDIPSAFIPFFIECLNVSGRCDDATSCLQNMPIASVAPVLLAWRPTPDAEVPMWTQALLDKARLFSSAPGAVVSLAPDSPWAWFQLADFEALELGIEHGMNADVLLNDYSLLQHAIEQRYSAQERLRAGWRRFVLLLARRSDVDLSRKLVYRLGSNPVFKKGLTPAKMVDAAVKLGRDDDPELRAALTPR